MTPEQHAQRIRQIELQLHIAENGLAIPYDREMVIALRDALAGYRKMAELAELDTIASDGVEP